MEITEKSTNDEKVLNFIVHANEQSLFSVLKVYLEAMDEVDVVGFYKEHHLVDETEMYLRVKEGTAKEIFKKALQQAKEELNKSKL